MAAEIKIGMNVSLTEMASSLGHTSGWINLDFCLLQYVCFDGLVVLLRLEQEEQARQKLQLEKVSIDSKVKKLEEVVAQHEDSNNKVVEFFIVYELFGFRV